MPYLPDVSDPHYLEEIGWFLYHEKHGPISLGETFDEERTLFSQYLLREVLELYGQNEEWLHDKTVVSIGCGCTGDLATWPAAVKIGIDPLVYAYQKLDMLVEDAPGTTRTVYLSVGAEDLPLMDDLADLVVGRNCLDHMTDPAPAVAEIRRILKKDGVAFLGVDIGGAPTADEPTVFTPESLLALLNDHFEILKQSEKPRPYSGHRDYSMRILARKKPLPASSLDKDALLRDYLSRVDWSGHTKVTEGSSP